MDGYILNTYYVMKSDDNEGKNSHIFVDQTLNIRSMLKFQPDDGNDVPLWRIFIFQLRDILVYLIKHPDVIGLNLTIFHVHDTRQLL